MVRQTLEWLGPCSSTDLVSALVKDHGFTPAAARQRVSRSKAIKKLAYIKFPRRARFVYLEADYASPQFWHALTDTLLRQSISYGGGLAALLARGGIMPVAHFHIACGAPIAQKRHLSAEAVLTHLERAGLVRTIDVQGLGDCVELSQQANPERHELASLRARLHTETLALGAIKDWARNLNMVSFHKVRIRDEGGALPKVGTFHWDLTGPSYLAPLMQWNGSKPKPGFLVCDVLTGINVSARELNPFIRKCVTLRSLPRVGRCMQLFVADGYKPEAFKLARENGVIPATLESLFGIEVAKALRDLTELLKDVYPQEDALERVDAVFSRLSRIEGAAINLRGALFEYLVAEIVRSSTPHSTIELNEILRDEQGQSAEVDVLMHHVNQSVHFIECKGYKPGGTIPDDVVERWLKERIPIIRKAAKSHPGWRRCSQQFEFWTTGQLSSQAVDMIRTASARVRKYTIALVDRDELSQRVLSTNSTAIKSTFNDHFRDHPLSEAEHVTRKRKRPLPVPPSSALTKREAPVAVIENDDSFDDILEGFDDVLNSIGT